MDQLSIDDIDNILFEQNVNTSEIKLKDTEDMHCDTPMKTYQFTKRCAKCGYAIEIMHDNTLYNSTILTNHNTRNSSTIEFKFSGPDANILNRHILGASNEYSKIQYRNTLKEFQQYQDQSDIKFPQKVVEEAAKEYSAIQKVGRVHRGDIKRSMHAECLKRVAERYEIIRTPKEYTTYVGIPESKLSIGESLIKRLENKNEIDTCVRINSKEKTKNYIERYMELLNIDQKYEPFIVAITDRAYRECISRSSGEPTRAVGAIYFIVVLSGLKIDIKEITEKCGISKTTFKEYMENVNKRKKKYFGDIINQYDHLIAKPEAVKKIDKV